MDHMSYTLAVEGVGRGEAEEIASALAEEGLAGREGVFDAYAFDPDYEVRQDGSVRFGSGGETKYGPDDFLPGLSRRYPHALFVRDATGYEDDSGRTYFKDGRSHGAERVVRYEPFDEAKLV